MSLEPRPVFPALAARRRASNEVLRKESFPTLWSPTTSRSMPTSSEQTSTKAITCSTFCSTTRHTSSRRFIRPIRTVPNEVNFALLHLFGYQFAPRYKDLYDKVRTSLVGFKQPSQYGDAIIRPVRKAQKEFIVSEWDNIRQCCKFVVEAKICVDDRQFSSTPRTDRE